MLLALYGDDRKAIAERLGRHLVAANALEEGRVDALFLIASPRSPLIRDLVTAASASLMSFERPTPTRARTAFSPASRFPRV